MYRLVGDLTSNQIGIPQIIFKVDELDYMAAGREEMDRLTVGIVYSQRNDYDLWLIRVNA